MLNNVLNVFKCVHFLSVSLLIPHLSCHESGKEGRVTGLVTKLVTKTSAFLRKEQHKKGKSHVFMGFRLGKCVMYWQIEAL